MHYGMLLDLSRCVACGGCVMACKRVNGTLGDVYWCNVYTQEQPPQWTASAMPSKSSGNSPPEVKRNCRSFLPV